MQERNRERLVNTALALVLIVTGPLVAAEPIQEVSVCELTIHAERYHSQLLAVQALFHLDEWVLYHPKCPGRDHWIAVADASDSEMPLVERISGDLSGIVEARFVGRFQGPNGIGYSNLGRLRTQLQVLEVSETRPGRKASPLDYDAPAPKLDAREDVDALGSRWVAAIEGRNAEELQEILTKDYVVVLPNGDFLAGLQALNSLTLPHQRAFEEGVARSKAPDTYEMRTRVFVVDSDTAVSIREISLAGFAKSGTEWEYVNLFRKVESRWRIAFSRIKSMTSR